MFYDAQHGDLFNLIWATVLIAIGPLPIYVSAIGLTLVLRGSPPEHFVSNDQLLDEMRQGHGALSPTEPGTYSD